MIRRWTLGNLGQTRKRAPTTLKHRKWWDRPVFNPPPLRAGNFLVSITELNLHHLASNLTFGRWPENGDAKRIVSRKGDGEASYWRVKTMVQWINRYWTSVFRWHGNQSAVSGGHCEGRQRLRVLEGFVNVPNQKQKCHCVRKTVTHTQVEGGLCWKARRRHC